jgi:hypothetical protein
MPDYRQSLLAVALIGAGVGLLWWAMTPPNPWIYWDFKLWPRWAWIAGGSLIGAGVFAAFSKSWRVIGVGAVIGFAIQCAVIFVVTEPFIRE